MKIRSTLELTEALDEALAWRKKEIAALRILIGTTNREHERAALRRAAIPILYAHWEGFAKQAAVCYLELVRRQGRSLEELCDCFVAISVRGKMRQAASSRRVSAYLEVVRFMLSGLGNPAAFSPEGAIDTESNLSSTVLREIIATLGLDYTHWAPREPLIDGSLLKSRNDVAHGDRAEIDTPTYDQLHGLVLDMMDQMRDGVENAAATRSYLRQAIGGTGAELPAAS